MLRAVAGNLGIPGGEVKFSDPGGLVRGSPDFLCQDNISVEVRDNRLSKKDNLMPIVYYALPQRIVKAILYSDPYPIRAGFLMGGNMLTSYTNADRTYEALKKLDFLSVSDLFMTPTAMLADIVLPAASYLEFDSVEQPWHIPIASVQQKVAEVGESWSDGMILNELAKKMGFNEHVWDNMEIPLNQILKPAGITFSEFRKIGVLRGTKLYRHYETGGFDTPSGKVELYSKTLKDWGFDPLPKYHEPPETPFSDPQLAKEYPLLMTSRKVSVYRHSGGRQISSLRKERADPTVNVHPETSNKLGIKDGDWVHVATKRGSIRQKANFVDGIDPRVIEVDYAWWFPEKGPEEMFRWRESNLNILTDIEPPYNREMGSTNMRGIACRIYKE
jgi:anaerobic selenocysteine-containing dehydrogenase